MASDSWAMGRAQLPIIISTAFPERFSPNRVSKPCDFLRPVLKNFGRRAGNTHIATERRFEQIFQAAVVIDVITVAASLGRYQDNYITQIPNAIYLISLAQVNPQAIVP